MRKFDDLSGQEKQSAIDHCLQDIFMYMIEEDMVPDFLDPYQEVIQAAMAEAERLLTPWFFLDILQGNIEKIPEMKQALLTEAERVAKISWYPNPDEMIVYLPEAKEDTKDLNLN